MEIVERIENKTREIGYSIKKLEQESGLSNGQIGKWKTQKPSYDKIASVAKTLNVSIDWLITGKETDNLTQEEQKLIDYYRKADERGKRNIIRTAEQECQELEYTTSKIG
jgi:transcriptional regulator with XRE-family HTH domain